MRGRSGSLPEQRFVATVPVTGVPMANVFLSYDHEDLAIANPLVQMLEKAGHTVWFDRHIHGGAQYSRKIEQALDVADAVVVLWSPRSLESAWVRDEAADGRDRGKLVPITVEGVASPMGFRQFQTIDLGVWKGRGKIPKAKELLNAVASQSANATLAELPTSAAPSAAPAQSESSRSRWLILAAVLALLAVVGVSAWVWFGRGGLPVVEVAAANSSPRSQDAASDLFVKLGSLAAIGEGKWQLVDESSAPKQPDLVFRTANTGSPSKPQANLVLLDGKDDALLWSREFSFPAGREADLRQQLSLTAGRVLGCALESRAAGGLRRDLLKLFLNVCATLSEASFDDPGKVTGTLRSIVAAEPAFRPAWARLLYADTGLVDFASSSTGDSLAALRQMQSDMAIVEKIAPDLPELTLAKLKFLPATAFAQRLNAFAEAAEKAPNKPEIFSDQSAELLRVGRMSDAIGAARRAAELDPLSPTVTTQLIMALAYGGQMNEARQELARAERLWAGTDALRDALWSFHLRYGDPALAKRYAGEMWDGLALYLNARADPTPANVEKMTAYLSQLLLRELGEGQFGWTVQALGEFERVDELLALIARAPTDLVAKSGYLFFRPGLAPLRRDPRFMAVASRIGLVDYWHRSNKWPNFCSDTQLPYNCKAEAAKYE